MEQHYPVVFDFWPKSLFLIRDLFSLFQSCCKPFFSLQVLAATTNNTSNPSNNTTTATMNAYVLPVSNHAFLYPLHVLRATAQPRGRLAL
jgi:hypothetical protein